MSVQRWDKDGFPDPDGIFVYADDHVAALAEAETRGYVAGVERENRSFGFAYDKGRAEALREARDAVAALPKGGMGLRAHELWRTALAAIDALGGQS